jgi:YD repeat-containing protein
MVYDPRGRRVSLSDPDTGSSSYVYNAIGELVSQTDAKGQTQTVTYDKLGRMKTRTTAEGICTWNYDTAAKGIGKLASVSHTNGYQETRQYDDLGRLKTSAATIDGESYTTSTGYDSLGRVDTVTYPQTGFAVNASKLTPWLSHRAAQRADRRAYWRPTTRCARASINETFGNGLTTQRSYDPPRYLSSIRTAGGAGTVQDLAYTSDVSGNLLTRTDRLQNLAETFSYDP